MCMRWMHIVLYTNHLPSSNVLIGIGLEFGPLPSMFSAAITTK